MRKKNMYCSPDPWTNKWYCSTKTKYGLVNPEKCELIVTYEELYNFIKHNIERYEFHLPFLVVKAVTRRLEEEGVSCGNA